MMVTREGPSTPPGARRAWGALADVVGHCVLVFAFIPPLASLPRWIASELRNPLNLQDAIVLTFVPVRGLILLLDAFSAGVVQGVAAGVVDGALLSVWLLSAHGRIPTTPLRYVVGALTGALAASLVILGAASFHRLAGADAAWRGPDLPFAIASGVLCGMLAVPTAARLATGSASVAPVRVDASA